MPPAASDRPPPSGLLMAALGAVAVLLHLPFLGRYGWSGDELYYLASADHLDWGFVDHPPLAAAVLAAWRGMFGDSLESVRLAAVLLGALAVVLVGLLARRMGGGRFAVALAGLAYLGAPAYLGMHHFYSAAAFEPVIWLAAAWLLVCATDARSSSGCWLMLGACVGLGILNGVSGAWLAAGVAVSLFLVAPRQLVRAGPWLAGVAALLVASPYLVWNHANGWPLLELLRDARPAAPLAWRPAGFFGQHALMMNPATVPIWTLGLAWLWSVGRARPFRVLGVIWVVSLLLLLALRGAQPSGLVACTALLLPAGAVAWERFLADWTPQARKLALAAVALTGLVLGPLAVPALPVPLYLEYATALGVAREGDAEGTDLPPHYADMHGWEALVDAVTRVHSALPPGERRMATILGGDYTDAAAIDHLGRELELPAAISAHNSYWSWGPRGYSGEVTIAIGGEAAFYERYWNDVVLAGRVACRGCGSGHDGRPIWIARHLRSPLVEIWDDLRRID